MNKYYLIHFVTQAVKNNTKNYQFIKIYHIFAYRVLNLNYRKCITLNFFIMKSIYLSVALLLTVVSFMASCSKSDDYLNVIPKDTPMVASINLQALGEKAGINDSENKEALGKLTDMLKKEMNAASFEKLQSIIENPKECGIDLNKPVYAFTSDEKSLILTAKVIDKEALTSSITLLGNNSKANAITEEEEGYSFSQLDNNSYLAFNENTLIAVKSNILANTDKMKLNAIEILNRKGDESIVSDKGFIKMQDEKADIAIYNNFEIFDNSYKNILAMGLGVEDAAKKCKLISGILFEDGKLVINSELYTEDEKIKELQEKQNDYLSHINNSLLKFFPKSSLCLMSISMENDKIFEMLKENKDFQKNISLEDAETIEKILKSIGKEITFGITDFNLTEKPAIVIYAEAKNGDILKELYNNKNSNSFTKNSRFTELKENEYLIQSGRDNIFIGYKNDMIYATNSETWYKNIGKKLEDSAENNTYAKDIKGKRMAYIIDFNALSQLPVMQMVLKSGDAKMTAVGSVLKNANNMSITYDDEITMTVQLKDTKTNFLKQMIQITKELAGI